MITINLTMSQCRPVYIPNKDVWEIWIPSKVMLEHLQPNNKVYTLTITNTDTGKIKEFKCLIDKPRDFYIATPGNHYSPDTVPIRTRHLCNGYDVDFPNYNTNWCVLFEDIELLMSKLHP